MKSPTSTKAFTTPTKSPTLKKGKAKDRRQSLGLNRRVSFSRHVGVMLFEKENKAPKTATSIPPISLLDTTSATTTTTTSTPSTTSTSLPLISSLLGDFGSVPGDSTDMMIASTSTGLNLFPDRTERTDMVLKGLSFYNQDEEDRTERTDMVLKALSFYKNNDDDEEEGEEAEGEEEKTQMGLGDKTEKTDFVIKTLSFYNNRNEEEGGEEGSEEDKTEPEGGDKTEKTDFVFQSLSFGQKGEEEEDREEDEMMLVENNTATTSRFFNPGGDKTEKTDFVLKSLSFHQKNVADQEEEEDKTDDKTQGKPEDEKMTLESIEQLLANSANNLASSSKSLGEEFEEELNVDMETSTGITMATSSMKLAEVTKNNVSSTSLNNLSTLLGNNTDTNPSLGLAPSSTTTTPARGGHTTGLSLNMTPTASSAMRLMTMTPTSNRVLPPNSPSTVLSTPTSASRPFGSSSRRSSRATPTKLPSMGSLVSLLPQGNTISDSIAALISSPGASLRKNTDADLILDAPLILPAPSSSSTASAKNSNEAISLDEFLAAVRVRFLDDVAARRRRSSMGGLLARKAVVAPKQQQQGHQHLDSEEGRIQRLKQLLVLKPELDAFERACERLTATTEELQAQTRAQAEALSITNPPIFASTQTSVSKMKALKAHCRAEAKLEKKKLELNSIAQPVISSLEANLALIHQDQAMLKKATPPSSSSSSSSSLSSSSSSSSFEGDHQERMKMYQERSQEVKVLEQRVNDVADDLKFLQDILLEWQVAMKHDPVNMETSLRFSFHNQFEIALTVACDQKTISSYKFSSSPSLTSNCTPQFSEFKEAMVNSAKIPELLGGLKSMAGLSSLLTEVSLRLGRLHDLFAELENIRCLYSAQVRLNFTTQPSPSIQFSFEGPPTTSSSSSSSETSINKKVTVVFGDLDYRYPFCPMKCGLNEVKGRVNEENLTVFIERSVQHRSYGFFQRFCVHLLSVCR